MTVVPRRTPTNLVLSALLPSLLLVSSCTERPTLIDDGTSSSTTSATSTTAPTPPTATAPPPTGVPPIDSSSGEPPDGTTDGGSSSDGNNSGMSFLPDSFDYDITFECDMFAQDCPEGDKCMPIAVDGGTTWGGTQCHPLMPVPDLLGAPCTVEGSTLTGIDSCEFAAMCWDVDPMSLQGTCVAMCTGDEANPVCAPGTTCMIANDGALILCLPDCDPLIPECQEGHLCVPANRRGWTCVPQAPALAAEGEPCEAGNGCAAGTSCAAPEATPGCMEMGGCCAATCELGVGACSDPMAECAPYYARGETPAGFDSVGICTAEPMIPGINWIGSNGHVLLPNLGE